MRAMILAAGRGARLRPLTDTRPKPLVEVAGQTLIERHVQALVAAGFDRIVINLGWLGEQIVETLGNGADFGAQIAYSREPPGALETAGGIVHALPLLGNAPFAVISADILTDFDFARLRRPLRAAAHLVLVDNPGHHPRGDFALAGPRVVAESHRPRLTFSGIAVFDPALFAGLKPGPRPLRPVLMRAIARNQVSGERFGGRWADIGTPGRLHRAQQSWSESS
ncbi:MAG: nucleotidyltransferase family protein [Pseudomonadota bacterium]|nr:MAG: nucleotidyltransferase family protein [Pseudomonadota bacterium]